MGRPAGRPKAIERKTTFSISMGLSGWLEFRGQDYPRNVSEYLCTLAEEDRAAVRENDPETWDRYLGFLKGTHRDAELDSVSQQ